jgi:hypothetical protein
MTNYKNLIQEAIEVRDSVTPYIRQTISEFRDGKAKINNNKHLTNDGKKAAIDELGLKYEKQFLMGMKKKYEEVHNLLDEAKTESEKILSTPLPSVSKQQEMFFESTMQNIEGRVTFANSLKQATVALEELLDVANEPILAKRALDNFIELSKPTLSLSGSMEKAALKQKLGNMYQQLYDLAQVEGAHPAREALQQINVLKNAGFVTGYVQDALKEISINTANNVNTPFSYFAKS